MLQVVHQDTRDLRFSDVGTLILKTTNRCNLDCGYCYENVGLKGTDVSLATFESIVERCLTTTTRTEVLVVFHGGEPTLLDDDWFVKATQIARHHARRYGKEVRFLAQSNMIRMNADRLKIFSELRISLGVSLDAPPVFADGQLRSKAEAAFRNFKRARDAGLSSGILMTINPANFALFGKVMRWLADEAGILDFKANVFTPVGIGVNLRPLTPHEVFCAQRDILDYMLDHSETTPVEQNLHEMVLRYVEGRTSQSLCNEQVCGAGRGVLSITMKGDILPCGRFQWDQKEMFLGNIDDGETSRNVSDPRITRLHSLHPENWVDCASCEARRICNQGCQAFIVRSKSRRNVECEPTKLLFAHMRARHDDIVAYYISAKERELRKEKETCQETAT